MKSLKLSVWWLEVVAVCLMAGSAFGAGNVGQSTPWPQLKAAIESGGLVTFTNAGGVTVFMGGELVITKDTTVDAGPHTSYLFAQAGRRHFTVAKGGSLTLRRLVLRKGGPVMRGGAVFNQGTLLLDTCTIDFSRVMGAGGQPGRGGGIYNEGTLTAVGTAFNDCVAQGQPATASLNGGSGLGGAISNLGGAVELFQCSLERNSAFGGNRSTLTNGGIGAGGGVFSDGGELRIAGGLIKNNRAHAPGQAAQGGGVWVNGPAEISLSTFTDNYGGGNGTTNGTAIYAVPGVDLTGTLVTGPAPTVGP